MKRLLCLLLGAALALSLGACRQVEDQVYPLGDLQFTVGGDWEQVPPDDNAAAVFQPSWESQAVIALYLYPKEGGPYPSAQALYEESFPGGKPASPQEKDFQRLEDAAVLGEPALHCSLVVVPEDEEDGAFFVEQYFFDSPENVWAVALSIPVITPTASQVLKELVEGAAPRQ